MSKKSIPNESNIKELMFFFVGGGAGVGQETVSIKIKTPSHSPYSSPNILCGGKPESIRFCK